MLTSIYAIIIVLGIILTSVIMAQPSNQESLTSAFTGGSNLFSEGKVRGVQQKLRKATLIIAAIIAIVAIAAQVIM